MKRVAARLIPAALLIVAVIHAMPLAGVVGAQRLQDLYGIPVAEPNLELLLRHRAVLFGMLAGLLAAAAFRPALQGLALVAGLISVVSFLVLAISIGSTNAALATVVKADWVALVLLVIASVAWLGRLGRRS